MSEGSGEPRRDLGAPQPTDSREARRFQFSAPERGGVSPPSPLSLFMPTVASRSGEEVAACFADSIRSLSALCLSASAFTISNRSRSSSSSPRARSADESSDVHARRGRFVHAALPPFARSIARGPQSASLSQRGTVSKTVSGSWVRRGFKSLSLRSAEPKAPVGTAVLGSIHGSAQPSVTTAILGGCVSSGSYERERAGTGSRTARDRPALRGIGTTGETHWGVHRACGRKW
jgi:hypothetical protein